MVSLNIGSLPRHIDELRFWLTDQNIDIIALNETRLDKTITDGEITIENYSIVRKDRNRNGGGVCVYVRNQINYRVRWDLIGESTESVVVEIMKPNSKSFGIIAAYRPPDSNNEIFFDGILHSVRMLDHESKEMYLLGDLNCDMLSNRPYRPTDILNSITEIYQLEQLITEPTRCTSKAETLIDLILTNRSANVAASGVVHLGISDHSLVFTIRKISISHVKNTHKVVYVRNFANFNVDNFRNDLQSLPWDDINMFDDVNETWLLWKRMFLSVVDKHAPIKRKRIRNKRNPWLTSELKQLLIQRDRLKCTAIRTKSIEDWNMYTNARNNCNNKLKEAKIIYYQRTFKQNAGNSKVIWSSINELTHKNLNAKIEHINNLKCNGRLISEPKEIAERFNKHFSEIGLKLSSSIQESRTSYLDYICETDAAFEIATIEECKVFHLLSKIDTKKATGMDQIPSNLLKIAAPVISKSLTVMFNKSVTTSTFPDDWKLARVTAIHKKEAKDDMNNYRPISVLSCISKVFERIIYDQLYTYLNDNNLISANQSGFRPFYSTSTALLDATLDWLKTMDQGNLSAVIFLDLAKAFDTVNHDILIHKLRTYGIQPRSLSWFQSYVCMRKQKCCVNGFLSSERLLGCGVPQGSILGPLMFLLFINDLPKCLRHSKARMYADDTNITVTGTSLEEIVNLANNDLANISEWLKANKLSLNTTKTEFMFIGSDSSLKKVRDVPLIFLNGKQIKRVRKTESLGIIIDEKLSWDEHIAHVSKKTSQAIGGLRRIRDYVPQQTAIIIFNSLIKPLFEYCDIVLDNMPITGSTRLQKLQNRAARVITKQGYDTRSVDIRNQLNWKTLSDQRKDHMLIMVFKLLNNLAPSYLRDHFETSENNNYSLRGRKMMCVLPKPRTEFLRRSFAFSGAKIWNELPESIRCIDNLNTFKSHLQSLLP